MDRLQLQKRLFKRQGKKLTLPLFDLGFIEAQAVCYDGYTAEGHCQGGQDGMQLAQHVWQGLKGVQDSGGYRD
jgi:hypothetical protein